MCSRVLLLALGARLCEPFVLNGVDSHAPAGLPGTAHRWSMPADTGSSAGLAGGLAWVMDDAFCDNILGRFPERDLLSFVELPGLQFVSCDDVRDAILRGFATWTANHRLISFTNIGSTSPCQHDVTGELNDSCPWELFISTADGTAHPDLAAYVINHRSSAFAPDWFQKPLRSSAGVDAYGVDAYARSTMHFQTHLCWYLDATFCWCVCGTSHRPARPSRSAWRARCGAWRARHMPAPGRRPPSALRRRARRSAAAAGTSSSCAPTTSST